MKQLTFENVHFRYKGKKEEALKGISFTLKQGEKVALIGRNGSGKSTLILQANGILRPQKGKIYIDHKELRYDHHSLVELRRQVGVVFQNPDEQLFSASVFTGFEFWCSQYRAICNPSGTTSYGNSRIMQLSAFT